MQTFNSNNRKIYSLTKDTYLPEWMTRRERRKLLKQNPKLEKRIEILQGLEMPDVCSKLCLTPDGNFMIALGTYKPRLRCYEFAQNSLKFEQCLDYEALKVIPTNDNFLRLAILMVNRFIEFHVGSGRHYRTRVPNESRDFAFNEIDGDLYFVGHSDNIYRLNICQGQFMRPWQSACSELRCCDINNNLQLLAVGTDEGTLQIWDCRGRDMFTEFSVSDSALTVLQFGDSMKIAAGDTDGMVSLFDLRSKRP